MRQQEKTELSRHRIIEAATTEFASCGYKNATVNSLCQKHQISKGLLFYHFKNKEDIFLNCVKQSCNTMKEEIGVQLAQIEGTPEEKLVQLQGMVFGFYRQNPNIQRILYIATEDPPAGAAEQCHDMLSDMTSAMEQFVAENVRQLSLRPGIDADMVLNVLKDFLDYIYVRNKKHLGENYSEIAQLLEKRQKEIEFLIAMLLHGVVQ